MLSIVYAAEAQFRFDSEARSREHALLASIRDHRAHGMTVAPMSAAIPDASTVVPRVTRAAWARPIHAVSCAAA